MSKTIATIVYILVLLSICEKYVSAGLCMDVGYYCSASQRVDCSPGYYCYPDPNGDPYSEQTKDDLTIQTKCPEGTFSSFDSKWCESPRLDFYGCAIGYQQWDGSKCTSNVIVSPNACGSYSWKGCSDMVGDYVPDAEPFGTGFSSKTPNYDTGCVKNSDVYMSCEIVCGYPTGGDGNTLYMVKDGKCVPPYYDRNTGQYNEAPAITTSDPSTTYVSPDDCSTGRYISDGQCLPCQKGRYCPNGFYELSCPPGYMCDGMSVIPCPDSQFSMINESECHNPTLFDNYGCAIPYQSFDGTRCSGIDIVSDVSCSNYDDCNPYAYQMAYQNYQINSPYPMNEDDKAAIQVLCAQYPSSGSARCTTVCMNDDDWNLVPKDSACKPSIYYTPGRHVPYLPTPTDYVPNPDPTDYNPYPTPTQVQPDPTGPSYCFVGSRPVEGTCVTCNPGRYCPDGKREYACPPGYMCNGISQTACPQGQFSAMNETECHVPVQFDGYNCAIPYQSWDGSQCTSNDIFSSVPCDSYECDPYAQELSLQGYQSGTPYPVNTLPFPAIRVGCSWSQGSAIPRCVATCMNDDHWNLVPQTHTCKSSVFYYPGRITPLIASTTSPDPSEDMTTGPDLTVPCDMGSYRDTYGNCLQCQGNMVSVDGMTCRSCPNQHYTNDEHTMCLSYKQLKLHWNGYMSTSDCASNADVNYLSDAFYPSEMTGPSVTIRYDATLETIDIDVRAKYMAQDLAYVIRFSDFDPKTDDVNNPGSCENRIPDTYSDILFQDWWNHQPDAIGSNKSTNYKNPNGWNYTVYDCQNVGWSRSFSMAELSACKTPMGLSELSNGMDSKGNLVFFGNLTVTAVSPIYDGIFGGRKSGYMTKAWIHPFQLVFSTTSTAVVLFQNGGQFLDAIVGSIYIDSGYMYMTINTIYYAKNYGKIISVNNNASTNVYMEMISNIDPIMGPNPHSQSFTFRSVKTSVVFDGLYSFVFSAVDCPPSAQSTEQCTKSPDFLYTFKVVLSAEEDTNLYAATKFNVDIYDGYGFNVSHVDPFYSGDTACFKSSLDDSIPNLEDYSIWVSTAYLCLPDNQMKPLSYDGVKNLGCLNVTNYNRIVSMSSPTEDRTTSRFYNPTLYTLYPSYTAGLCITAMPQFLRYDGTTLNGLSNYIQYVQIEISTDSNLEKIKKKTVNTFSKSKAPIGKKTLLLELIKKKKELNKISVRGTGNVPKPNANVGFHVVSRDIQVSPVNGTHCESINNRNVMIIDYHNDNARYFWIGLLSMIIVGLSFVLIMGYVMYNSHTKTKNG